MAPARMVCWPQEVHGTGSDVVFGGALAEGALGGTYAGGGAPPVNCICMCEKSAGGGGCPETRVILMKIWPGT